MSLVVVFRSVCDDCYQTVDNTADALPPPEWDSAIQEIGVQSLPGGDTQAITRRRYRCDVCLRIHGPLDGGL